MFKTKLLVIALGAAFALPAMAEDAPVTSHKEEFHAAAEAASPFTFNVGLVTDYIYRGITQTAHGAAVQGGVDYAHASGLYAGAWGSNVSWIKDSGAIATGNTNIELDTYFGFKNSIAEDLSYDVGYVRYNYLGTYTPAAGFNNADTAEVYGAAIYKFATLKYSYGLLDGFLTIPGAKGTNYIDLSASYPVADSGVTIGAHIGKQTFVGTTADTFAAAGTTLTYTDYKLSASKDFSGYVVGLNYTSTNASSAWTYAKGDKWGKSVAALSVTHSF
ncbi:MAG: hypothetical protein EPO42_03300 [Gallionellaceae bacterium]|nr:MAG: hypothetical protein EPO42_03300 [Gallionellaceae bacterium]